MPLVSSSIRASGFMAGLNINVITCPVVRNVDDDFFVEQVKDDFLA